MNRPITVTREAFYRAFAKANGTGLSIPAKEIREEMWEEMELASLKESPASGFDEKRVRKAIAKLRHEFTSHCWSAEARGAELSEESKDLGELLDYIEKGAYRESPHTSPTEVVWYVEDFINAASDEEDGPGAFLWKPDRWPKHFGEPTHVAVVRELNKLTQGQLMVSDESTKSEE